MEAPRTVLLRNAAGSLTVLALVLTIAVGLPRLNRAVPGGRPVGNEPYEVGAGVTIVPPTGAQLDVTATRPGKERGTALFTLDGIRFAVVVDRYPGVLSGAAERLRRKITQTAGYQITDVERSTRTDQGVAGIRGTYTSPDRRGGYAVFLAQGLVAEVTVSGPEVQVLRRTTGVEESISSVTFVGGP